jgi:hypothetical protein
MLSWKFYFIFMGYGNPISYLCNRITLKSMGNIIWQILVFWHVGSSTLTRRYLYQHFKFNITSHFRPPQPQYSPLWVPSDLKYRVWQVNFLFWIWNAIWKRKLVCHTLYLDDLKLPCEHTFWLALGIQLLDIAYITLFRKANKTIPRLNSS